MLRIPVSIGELLDKITILEIKAQRIEDDAKRDNVKRELDALSQSRRSAQLYTPELEALVQELRQVNVQLWEIEDHIRLKEAEQMFDQEFITLARSVYQTNDKRAAIKRQINDLTGSQLVEEKSYKG